MEIYLRRLEGVPSEREESVVGSKVWQLNLLGDGVPSGNAGKAGVMRRSVNALASPSIVGLKSVASEPVVPPAGLTLLAIGTESTFLAINVCAWQNAGFEAVFCGLLLLVGGEVIRVEEFLDQVLIVAHAISEHSAVITVVVDTPLDFDDFAGLVSGYDLVTPVLGGLVVINAIAGIVAAWPASADSCSLQVRPSVDWLEDGAFGT